MRGAAGSCAAETSGIKTPKRGFAIRSQSLRGFSTLVAPCRAADLVAPAELLHKATLMRSAKLQHAMTEYFMVIRSENCVKFLQVARSRS